MNFNRHEPAQHLSRHAQVLQTLPTTLHAVLLFTGQGLFILGQGAEKWQRRASHWVFAPLLPTVFLAPHAFLNCVLLNFVSDFQHKRKRKWPSRDFGTRVFEAQLQNSVLSPGELIFTGERWWAGSRLESVTEQTHVFLMRFLETSPSHVICKVSQLKWEARVTTSL